MCISIYALWEPGIVQMSMAQLIYFGGYEVGSSWTRDLVSEVVGSLPGHLVPEELWNRGLAVTGDGGSVRSSPGVLYDLAGFGLDKLP